MTEITTPDSDQTENRREAATILRTGADTYEKKTRDYGSSWRNIGVILEIMAHGEPIVLDSTEKVIAFGLFTRRLDKFSREFFGTFFADEMNFESVGDSAEDEMVYAAMSAENHADMAEKAALVERLAEGYRETYEDTDDVPAVDDAEAA